MKKILNEKRLQTLAGINEANTRSMYKSRRDAAKRARHQAEKEFFGSDDQDPLVTTDVPQVAQPAPQADPNATQPLSADQLAQIAKDVPEEARRPVAMKIYQSQIAPEYNEDELEILVHNNNDVADALSQLIGWFHPAFHDSRGRPTYDNPSRLGIKVAQEFEKEGLDIVDDAEEFSQRIEKYVYDEAKAEFKKNVAHRDPATDVKVGRSATPGTREYEYLQDLFRAIDAQDEFRSAPTGKIKK
tara:strand:+ start:282 stop:1013 length:732 start_codon:yes stop_codon:yes gene_type:complete